MVHRAAANQTGLETEGRTGNNLNRLKDFHGFRRDLRSNPIASEYRDPIKALHTVSYIYVTGLGREIAMVY